MKLSMADAVEITLASVACAAVTFFATIIPYAGVALGIALAILYGFILGSVDFSDLFKAVVFVATVTGFCLGLRLRSGGAGLGLTIGLTFLAAAGLVGGFAYKSWVAKGEEKGQIHDFGEGPDN